MKDNDTPDSKRFYRTTPPTMIDPNEHEELDKFQKSLQNASRRSKRFKYDPQPPTYDPKVVSQHKRPPKDEIFVSKDRNACDFGGYGGDGGDGGDLCIHPAQIPHTSEVIG